MRTLLLTLLVASPLLAIEPTPTPVSPDGKRATIDLPTSQHMRNVGGRDGSGLCVFTSIQHGGYWQNISSLDGFRKFMQTQPGGGYPEKVDKMIAAYCKKTNRPVPVYIQHTGGEEEFLELALKTGRVPCVTYAGVDDFYVNEVIAHMVNLTYLDGQTAAILDNNRPGNWIWMTRDQFINRWKGLGDNGQPLTVQGQQIGGGWAIVFLDPPPPPYTVKPSAFEFMIEQCGPNGCRFPRVLPQVQPDINRVIEPKSDVDGWVQKAPGLYHRFDGGKFAGLWDGKWHPAFAGGYLTEGQDLPKDLPLPGDPEALAVTKHIGGVVSNRISADPKYTISGPNGAQEIPRREAHGLFGAGPDLLDDSVRWHLTAVGDLAFLKRFQGDVSKLSQAIQEKLLIQAYLPTNWAVGQYSLPTGISLRKPSPDRTGAQVGALDVNYLAVDLDKLFTLPGGPLEAPPKPKQPDPTPTPDAPSPKAPEGQTSWAVPSLLAILGLVFLNKRRK